MIPLMTASQPHSPTRSSGGRSPNSPNQSKPRARRPKKKNSNPASSPKKPRTEIRMGGFRTRRVPPTSPNSGRLGPAGFGGYHPRIEQERRFRRRRVRVESDDAAFDASRQH